MRQAGGVGCVYQAVKALAIARQFVFNDNLDYCCFVETTDSKRYVGAISGELESKIF